MSNGIKIKLKSQADPNNITKSVEKSRPQMNEPQDTTKIKKHSITEQPLQILPLDPTIKKKGRPRKSLTNPTTSKPETKSL